MGIGVRKLRGDRFLRQPLRVSFLLPVFISCFSAFPARSQEPAVVKGKIIDAETKNPIPFVNVFIKDTQLGAATDTSGRFEIVNIPPDLYVVEFRHVAYKKRYHVLRLNPNDRIVLSVELFPEPIVLEEIAVTSEAEPLKRAQQSYASMTITAKHIKETGAVKLSDILRSYESGASMQRSRRRFDRDPYIIYLDGAYVQYIPGSLDAIVEVNQIDHIEINRWVGAAPNVGPGTSDRVIQIFTKKPKR